MMENLLLTTGFADESEPLRQGKIVYGQPTIASAPAPAANRFYGFNVYITDKNINDEDNFVIVSETGGTNADGLSVGALYAYRPSATGQLTAFIQKIECPDLDKNITGFGTNAIVSGDGKILIAASSTTNGSSRLFVFVRDGLLWKYSKSLNTGVLSKDYPIGDQKLFLHKDNRRLIVLLTGNATGDTCILTYDLESEDTGSLKKHMLNVFGYSGSSSFGKQTAYSEETGLMALFASEPMPTIDRGVVIVIKISEDAEPVFVQKILASKISNYSKGFSLGGLNMSASGKRLIITAAFYRHLDVSTNEQTCFTDVLELEGGRFVFKQNLIPATIPTAGGLTTYSKYGSVANKDCSILITTFDGTAQNGINNSGAILTASVNNSVLSYNNTAGQMLNFGYFTTGQGGRRNGAAIAIDDARGMVYVGASGENYNGKASSGLLQQISFTRKP